MSTTPNADAHVAALAKKMQRQNPLVEDEIPIKRMIFSVCGQKQKENISIEPTSSNRDLRLYVESLTRGHRPAIVKLDAMDKSIAADFWDEKWKDRDRKIQPPSALATFAKADEIRIEYG